MVPAVLHNHNQAISPRMRKGRHHVTKEEKALLIAYLVDAREISPRPGRRRANSVPGLVRGPLGRGIRRGPPTKPSWKPTGCGSVASIAGPKGHLPHCPTAGRLRPRHSLRLLRRRPRRRAWPRDTPNAGTPHWKTWLGSAGSWTTSIAGRGYNGGPRQGRSGLVMPIRHQA